ncbi:MAG: hypothetical protein B7X39_14150 [Lysobacterales bacterium 14-68-21]|nr:MAG: hypothetical protein B7X45_13040 [Xanthomonadales bacterium 15-68-25]OZB65388.1 MAG: hypothetical protein B7X39_14150 [Xanthomonadales bacterium 14-68-21]
MSWWAKVRWTRLWSLISNRLRMGRRHGWRIRKSRRLRKVMRQLAKQPDGWAKALGYLRKVDPFVFEEVILTSFEEANLMVKRNLRYTGDGGSDGVVVFQRQTIHIQAKRYGSHVQQSHVRDFARMCEREGTMGLFVHTGKTGQGTKDVLMGTSHVRVVSGRRLIELVSEEGAARACLAHLVEHHRGSGHALHRRSSIGPKLHAAGQDIPNQTKRRKL